MLAGNMVQREQQEPCQSPLKGIMKFTHCQGDVLKMNFLQKTLLYRSFFAGTAQIKEKSVHYESSKTLVTFTPENLGFVRDVIKTVVT